MKIVRAIRQGRILPNKPKTASIDPQFYAIWNEEPAAGLAPPPAPKPHLPGNAESYNPPEEYLPTPEERAKWAETDPEDREREFLPQKYAALRLVPAYDSFIKERFSRQLDLYLAPRVQRVKLRIDPESLIPKLPSPNSLRPFPVYRSLQVSHEEVRTRAISVSPDGAWVVSGDESGVVRLWEAIVGKEVKRWTFKGKIGSVEWCPRTDVSFFAIGVSVHFCSNGFMIYSRFSLQRGPHTLPLSSEPAWADLYCYPKCARARYPPTTTRHGLNSQMDVCSCSTVIIRHSHPHPQPSTIT